MQEKMALGKCCKFPFNTTSMMDSPTCKQHLDAAESGDKKEKFKAYICLSECYYKHKGAINDAGELNKEKLHALIDNELKDHPEFKTIASASVDKCLEESGLKLLFS